MTMMNRDELEAALLPLLRRDAQDPVTQQDGVERPTGAQLLRRSLTNLLFDIDPDLVTPPACRSARAGLVEAMETDELPSTPSPGVATHLASCTACSVVWDAMQD